MNTPRETLRRYEIAALQRFSRDVFIACGLSEVDAARSADVMVVADVRGIPSHGIGRLRRYVNGLTTGLILTDARAEIVTETATSLVIDAHGGMGAPVSADAMERIIAKAASAGTAFGCVKDSNHFGIAAYYAMLALPHDMIGIAATNTAALGLPTSGRQVMFGTNPLAFAAPAGEERAFVLDMSTTVVTQGKLEVYDRLGEPLPLGWAADDDGTPTQDARAVLDNMLQRRGGGILPLGGEREESGGHKGYGLAVMVDILCSVLCGGAFGRELRDTPTSFSRVSHFFGAIQIAAFRDPLEFRRDMDRLLADLRHCPPAMGAERVYFAGQKEFEHEAEVLRRGIPLYPETVQVLEEISRQTGVAMPEMIGEKSKFG